jgi:predicted O-methyltransferase YrrM
MAATGRAIGKSGTIIDAGSMSTPNNILTLRSLHLVKRAEHTMEIGLRMGGSCLAFAQTHKDLGFPPRRQHVAIDPYQNNSFNDGSGLRAIERAGLSGYVEFLEMQSCSALPQLLRDGRSFEIIYLDGSHNFEDVLLDLYFATKLLTKGGIVLFDDSAHPHVHKVVRFAGRNLDHCLRPVSLHRFRPANSIRYKIADLLGRVQLTAFERIGMLERPAGYTLRTF